MVVTRESLESEFKKATEQVKRLKTRLDEDEILELYALYKQALFGNCNIPKPVSYDIKGIFKWEAWNNMKGMDQDTAKQKYIQLAQSFFNKYGVDEKDS